MHRVLNIVSTLVRLWPTLFFLPQPCVLVSFAHRWSSSHYIVFLELLLLLAGASVFEGELRDGGLVQFAFAEIDQSQVLIVGCLS